MIKRELVLDMTRHWHAVIALGDEDQLHNFAMIMVHPLSTHLLPPFLLPFGALGSVWTSSHVWSDVLTPLMYLPV